MLTIGDLLEPFEDGRGRLMLTDLHYDRCDGVVDDREQGEDDQVGDDHEKVVTGGLRTVQARSGRCALVLADTPHDDWQEVSEDERQRRGQDTGHDGKLASARTSMQAPTVQLPNSPASFHLSRNPTTRVKDDKLASNEMTKSCR